jgi:hypothetical protein
VTTALSVPKVTYEAAWRAAFVKHFEAGQMEVQAMVYQKRNTVIEEQGTPYLMWAYEVSKCTFKRRLK